MMSFSLFPIFLRLLRSSFFFFNDTATTEIYTLSLHDALPIWITSLAARFGWAANNWLFYGKAGGAWVHDSTTLTDRKSTRLNSSHLGISYAVFCLKKKKKKEDRCVGKWSVAIDV